MRMKNFHRIGWVTYPSFELCSQALKELNGHKVCLRFDSYHTNAVLVQGLRVDDDHQQA